MKNESTKGKMLGAHADSVLNPMEDYELSSVINVRPDCRLAMAAETVGFQSQHAKETRPVGTANVVDQPATGVWEIAPTHFGASFIGIILRWSFVPVWLIIGYCVLLIWNLLAPFNFVPQGAMDWMQANRLWILPLAAALTQLFIWYCSKRELVKRNMGENGFRVKIDVESGTFYAWVNWDGWFPPRAHKDDETTLQPNAALRKLLPLCYYLQHLTGGYANVSGDDKVDSKEWSIRFRRPLLKDVLLAAPCLMMAVVGGVFIVAAVSENDLFAPLSFGLVGIEDLQSLPIFGPVLVLLGGLFISGAALAAAILLFRRWLCNRLKVTIISEGEEGRLIWVNWQRFIPYGEWVLFDDTASIKKLSELLIDMQRSTGLPFQFRPLQY